MAKLSMNVLPISMFSYEKSSNLLVGEMSSVEGSVKRVYDDAIDVGLEIQGKYTKVLYVYTGELIYNQEGEIMAYVFKTCGADKGKPVLHLLNT